MPSPYFAGSYFAKSYFGGEDGGRPAVPSSPSPFFAPSYFGSSYFGGEGSARTGYFAGGVAAPFPRFSPLAPIKSALDMPLETFFGMFKGPEDDAPSYDQPPRSKWAVPLKTPEQVARAWAERERKLFGQDRPPEAAPDVDG